MCSLRVVPALLAGSQIAVLAGFALAVLGAAPVAGATPVTYAIRLSDASLSGSLTIDSEYLGRAFARYPVSAASLTMAPGGPLDPLYGEAINDQSGNPVGVSLFGGQGDCRDLFDGFTYYTVCWSQSVHLFEDRTFDFAYDINVGPPYSSDSHFPLAGTYAIVPEPSTLSLLTAGVALLIRRGNV